MEQTQDEKLLAALKEIATLGFAVGRLAESVEKLTEVIRADVASRKGNQTR
jgi:hypothetical protein